MGLLCFGAASDWLSAKSQRLYVDEGTNPASRSGIVAQHFGIRGNYVTPEISTRDNARFVFPVNLRVPHALTFTVEPEGVPSYEIYFEHGGTRQLLRAEKGQAIASPHHFDTSWRRRPRIRYARRMVWLDLQLVRPVFLWPFYLIGALALGVLILWPPRARIRRGAEWLALLISTLLCLAFAEWVLRMRTPNLPPAIVAARNEFGLVGEDSRLLDPHRYKIRLKPNLNTYSEWRFGDIVRFNYIPKEVSPATVHRYPIRTDAEGFRNDFVRNKIDVAALGDSFTDGTTGPASESWPVRFAQLSGRTVQNYGTSGFGPQQELYVLRDYALAHQPHLVVLAFCAGNDLSDAEAFDLWEKNPARPMDERLGWRLAESYRRYETFYLWSVGKVAVEGISQRLRSRPAQASESSGRSGPDKARFDRGMFTICWADHLVQFAFLPHYLQKLATPRSEIERSRGWELTQAALREMKTECARHGTKFVLMFIPEKTQVYWPLAERFFSNGQLQEAVDFSARENQKPLRLEDIRANRLALNALLHDFCAQEHIPMLDLTAPLQRAVESGREMYFPDDTHWNAAGHDLAARELTKFMAGQP